MGDATYALSSNLYIKKRNKKIILFNPDAFGNPVLVKDDLCLLFDKRFKRLTKNRILALLPNYLTPIQKEQLFSFLKDYCFVSAGVSNLVALNNAPQSKSIGVWLHITNKCNLRCPYCFVNRNSKTMDKQIIKRFVLGILQGAATQDINRITIKFSGGEPLLALAAIRQTVNEFELNKISTIDVRFSILSNGVYINDNLLSFMKTHRIGIAISLDGYGNIHDRTRVNKNGKGSFKTIEKNIELLQSNDIQPFIMATISDDTIDELPLLTKWLLDHNLFTRYSFVRSKNDPLRNYKQFCRRIVSSMSKNIEVIDKHHFGPEFVLKWKLADLSFDHPIIRQPCEIGKSHFVVNWNGDLALCPMSLEETIGNVNDNIYEQYAKHESKYIQKQAKNVLCQKCQWHRTCGTGCPILNESLLGHPNERSPFCEAYRQLIPQYIDIYGWALEKLGGIYLN